MGVGFHVDALRRRVSRCRYSKRRSSCAGNFGPEALEAFIAIVSRLGQRFVVAINRGK
jgi:hypothetical protein